MVDGFDTELATSFGGATMEAHYVHDRDITKPEVMTDVARAARPAHRPGRTGDEAKGGSAKPAMRRPPQA